MPVRVDRTFVTSIDLGVRDWDWTLYEAIEGEFSPRFGGRRAHGSVILADTLGEIRAKSVAEAHRRSLSAGSKPAELTAVIRSSRTTLTLSVRPRAAAFAVNARIESIDELEARGAKAIIEERTATGTWVNRQAPERQNRPGRWRRLLARLLWTLALGVIASLIAGVLLLRFG